MTGVVANGQLFGSEQDVLFAEPSSTRPIGQWHVLQTRSRQEKVVAQDLAAMGIAHFLPLSNEARYHGRRKVVVAEPLFPGYVFLHGQLDDVYRVDRTKRIARIIEVKEQQKLTVELRNIRLALARGANLDPFPFLKEGVPVVVKAGPFEGLRGLVEHRWAWDRLVLQVDLLGRGSSLEIDGSLLEVLA